MRRCRQRDLSGDLLEQGGWDHLCLPAECEALAEHWELLWPDRFGRNDLEELKHKLGSYAAAGQLQQRPSPLVRGLFKRHRWRYFQPQDANFPPVVSLPDGTLVSIPVIAPSIVGEQIQSWDCSFKDPETPDFVVGLACGHSGPSTCSAIRSALAWTAPPR